MKTELLTEIQAANAGPLIVSGQYGCQEKHNGKRRLLVKQGDHIFMTNREGERRECPRWLRELFAKLPHFALVVDGELLPKGRAFELFDILLEQLEEDALFLENWCQKPYRERLKATDRIATWVKDARVRMTATIVGKDNILAFIAAKLAEKAEGVVFKNLDALYREGRAGQHFKLKFVKMLSAVVMGMHRCDAVTGVWTSVDIGLYNSKGKLVRIAGVSLIGREQVEVGDVIEVKYLYGTRTNHIVQPVMDHKRDDIDPTACTLDQIVVNRDEEAA